MTIFWEVTQFWPLKNTHKKVTPLPPITTHFFADSFSTIKNGIIAKKNNRPHYQPIFKRDRLRLKSIFQFLTLVKVPGGGHETH